MCAKSVWDLKTCGEVQKPESYHTTSVAPSGVECVASRPDITNLNKIKYDNIKLSYLIIHLTQNAEKNNQ